MTNSLVPFTDMEKMATTLAAKGLFGTSDPQDLLSLMLIAQAEGLHPATVAVDYDFIQKKPAKKPAAMLRDFIKHGGRVEWHALDDTQADATFSHPSGGTVRVRWDMKKAAQAQLAGREMWKKYPSAMLRSRCVSEGMRAVFPAATGGLYTPEEARDITPVDNSNDTDIPGEVIDETTLARRDEVVAAFRAAMALDVEEDAKAVAVYEVHKQVSTDHEFYIMVGDVMTPGERRAIKAYVSLAKQNSEKVLPNGRAA